MVSTTTFNYVTKWSRMPTPHMYPTLVTCGPAEASEALEKAGPTPPPSPRAVQRYTNPQLLGEEPESVRAGIARYIPRKSLGSVAGWLYDDDSPLVHAEILTRQEQGDGHLTATKKTLQTLYNDTAQCRKVAGLMGTLGPWLTNLAKKNNRPAYSEVYTSLTALLLLAASRPLTVEEQRENVLRWVCGHCKAGHLDGSVETLTTLFHRATYCCVGGAWQQRAIFAIIEALHCHHPPGQPGSDGLILNEYEATVVLTHPPRLNYSEHRAVVEKLDKTFQRNPAQWRALAETQADTPTAPLYLGNALTAAGFHFALHPVLCKDCLTKAH